MEISLTDELPTSRAVFFIGEVARYSDHPELPWGFTKANMKALLANSYVPSLFNFFSETTRVAELKVYAKTNLPSTAASSMEVAKAVDEVEFRAEFKRRLISQSAAWTDKTGKVN